MIIRHHDVLILSGPVYVGSETRANNANADRPGKAAAGEYLWKRSKGAKGLVDDGIRWTLNGGMVQISATWCDFGPQTVQTDLR